MRSATIGPSSLAASRGSKAGRLPAHRTTFLAPTTPRSTGWSKTATTSPTSPASTPTGSGPTISRTTRPSSRSDTTSTGPASSAANVEEARDSGVNILFWSGNEVYWKTRWETSISADGTAYRTLVCYKETWANGDPNAGPEDYNDIDPTNIWTGTWRDTRFIEAQDENGNYIAGGADPDPISGLRPFCNCAENSLTGQLFGPDGTGEFGGSLDVPAPFAGLRVWRNTDVANGGALDLAPGILGYEWNTSPEDDLRPAGLIKLSDTTIPWGSILADQGNQVAAGRGHPQPVALSRRERCAGLRRGHRVLELGAQRSARRLALRCTDRQS